MQCVILCGGKATRLGDIAKNTPKGMLPIGGKPVLVHQIEYLKKNGITEIILAVGNLSLVIMKYFGNGEEFGVNISYSYDLNLGTGGAIRLCKDLLKDDTFILMNGDTIADVNLNHLLKEHNRTKELITISYDNNFVSIGVCAVNIKLIDVIPEGICSLEDDVLSKIRSDKYIYKDKWFDIGESIEKYESYKIMR